MKKAVIGMVESRERAEALVLALQQAGFSPSDISVLFPDKHGPRDFAHERSSKAPEGAVAGASAGGAVGGTIGLLAGIGAILLPGVGAFIAAGPVMAALSGVAAGAAVGGVAGALVGMGIPEIEAKTYESKLRGGNILIAVHSESREERAVASDMLKRAGAHDVEYAAEAPAPYHAR
jgi:hypothetical protein